MNQTVSTGFHLVFREQIFREGLGDLGHCGLYPGGFWWVLVFTAAAQPASEDFRGDFVSPRRPRCERFAVSPLPLAELGEDLFEVSPGGVDEPFAAQDGSDCGEALEVEELPGLAEFLGLAMGQEFEDLLPVLGEDFPVGV